MLSSPMRIITCITIGGIAAACLLTPGLLHAPAGLSGPAPSLSIQQRLDRLRIFDGKPAANLLKGQALYDPSTAFPDITDLIRSRGTPREILKDPPQPGKCLKEREVCAHDHDRQALEARLAYLASRPFDLCLLNQPVFEPNLAYLKQIQLALARRHPQLHNQSSLFLLKLLNRMEGRPISVDAIRIRNRPGHFRKPDLRGEMRRRLTREWDQLLEARRLFAVRQYYTLTPKQEPILLDYIADCHPELTAAALQYGIDPEIIVATMWVETHLGDIPLNYNTVDVLFSQLFFMAPLPHASHDERARLHRIQDGTAQDLIALIDHHLTSDTDIFELSSNFLGALGWPQFMPRNIAYMRRYDSESAMFTAATPYIELQEHADAIGSTAYFLMEKCGLGRLDWRILEKLPQVIHHWEAFDARISPAVFTRHPDMRKGMISFSEIMRKKSPALYAKLDMAYYADLAGRMMNYNLSSGYVLSVLKIAKFLHDSRPARPEIVVANKRESLGCL